VGGLHFGCRTPLKTREIDCPSSAYSTSIQYCIFSSDPTQATLIKATLSCILQPLTGCHTASPKHARERGTTLYIRPNVAPQDTQHHPRLQKWERSRSRYRHGQIRLQCCLQLDKFGVPFIARTAARLPRLADKRRCSASVSRSIQIYSVCSTRPSAARHGSLLISTT
jgi:hypothetical protein